MCKAPFLYIYSGNVRETNKRCYLIIAAKIKLGRMWISHFSGHSLIFFVLFLLSNGTKPKRLKCQSKQDIKINVFGTIKTFNYNITKPFCFDFDCLKISVFN